MMGRFVTEVRQGQNDRRVCGLSQTETQEIGSYGAFHDILLVLAELD